MKKFYVLLSCLSMTLTTAFAQIEEPKFIGEAALLNADGTLTMLENVSGSLAMTFTVSTDGVASQVRFPSSEKIQMIVKASNNSDSPSSVIVAFKMKAKKNKRTAAMGAYGVKSKDIIPFKADAYGKSSYIITFENLAPGEYGIWYGDKMVKNALGEHPMAFFGIE